MTSTMAEDQLRPLCIRDIFEGPSYRVPLYQRAYAWTSAEVQTLLADIRDARINSVASAGREEIRDYFIGSLVVNTVRSDDRVIYEVVDGQQRLTTLFIVLAVASGVDLDGRPAWADTLDGKLSFEGRDGAHTDLQRLARDGAAAINRLSTDGIKQAAELVDKAVARGSGPTNDTTADIPEAVFSADDLEYMLDHVKVLRTELPHGTDLNHYFEVMNTRGEQLEKHEILKSRLISFLKDPAEQTIFSQVWDACAVLDRHIQTQFPTKRDNAAPSKRDRIFGDQWEQFIPRNGTELFNTLAEFSQQRGSGTAMNSLLPQDSNDDLLDLFEVLNLRSDDHLFGASDHADEDDPSSYGAIIDFPNLLLHVLKIQQRETHTWAGEDDRGTGFVRLEDKYLLAEFERAKPSMDEAWVREFAQLLLKTRYLMDTYVIRTQRTTAGDDEENWVLRRAHKYKSEKGTNQLSARGTFRDDDGQEPLQRRVLMLQAMFQVTDSRRASKYFLFQALQWLHRQDDPSRVNGEAFAQQLESSACERLHALNFTAVLHQGTHVPNFLFNLLDYELWRLASVPGAEDAGRLLGTEDVAALVSAAPAFRFRYRTSVEHFYPATPAAEQGHRPLEGALGDRFGNLCIMSRSENSRRNNLMPKAKAEEFASTGQSLKFQLMADLTRVETGWGENQIMKHGDAMERVLENVVGHSKDRGV
ncbi:MULTISPECIES: DUF262 domain-containing protein [unclassified Arthrobacter]|uniref:GmrSD restriction endonuclease domain-containing protein n=1 Tax=unclassified Arthrobacter TaxID=235627 RepID=UPI001E3AA1F9|nr:MULTISPECIES: DUF262 domain-containing protein [unclassified Arthrobacter]MCC9146352.1 DUF262 domain-containing HNH endonuclease family protein [Arthrobacter sp. zg-Y919]MDK1277582.1 DUF262 domain-containing protein [Arthrobacter sp. zg.Y919]WIB02456.1 DUF262 domain-containing protein [Arthrobacter sp. zg-Y919]